MTRVLVRLALGCTVALGSTFACSDVLAAPSGYSSAQHFVTITGGYARFLGDVRPGYSTPTGTDQSASTRANFSDAAEFGARYRYAIRRGTEVFGEFDRIKISGTDTIVGVNGTYVLHLAHRSDSWGAGVRTSDLEGRIRPFFQAGLVLAREWSGDEASLQLLGTNLGFGAATGMDIGISRSLSVPVELAFRFAAPLDEVTTLGLRTGLTWGVERGESRATALPFVPPPVGAQAAPAPRLHVAIQYGVGGHVGTIQPESYGYLAARSTTLHPQSTLPGSSVGDFFDLAPGTAMGIAFRGSIRPGTDVVFEGVRAVSVRSETFGGISVRRSRYSTLGIGLGMRKTRVHGRVRPFAQAGLALMDTGVRFLSADSGSRGVSGVATNFVTGAEVVASRTLSIPVECRALIGWTGGDQAHVGVQAGLAYGFGR